MTITKNSRVRKRSSSINISPSFNSDTLLQTDRYDIIKSWDALGARISKLNFEELKESFCLWLETWPRMIRTLKTKLLRYDGGLVYYQERRDEVILILGCSRYVLRWTFRDGGKEMYSKRLICPVTIRHLVYIREMRVFVIVDQDCCLAVYCRSDRKADELVVAKNVDHLDDCSQLVYLQEPKIIVAAGIGFISSYYFSTAGKELNSNLEKYKTVKCSITQEEYVKQIIQHSPSETLAVLTSRQVLFINYTTMTEYKKFRNQDTEMGLITCCCYYNSKYLLTGYRSGDIKVWDSVYFNELLALNGHTKEIVALHSKDNARLLVSASRNGWVLIWCLEPLTKKPLQSIGVDEEISLMGLTADPGRSLGFWCVSGVHLYFYKHYNYVHQFVEMDAEIYKLQRVRGLDVHPNRILVATTDGGLKFINSITGTTIGFMFPMTNLKFFKQIIYHFLREEMFLLMHDGSVMVVSCRHSPFRGQDLYRPLYSDEEITCLAGGQLALAGPNGDRLRDVAIFAGFLNGQVRLMFSDVFVMARLQAHKAQVWALEMPTERARNGCYTCQTQSTLISAGDDRRVVVWQLYCRPLAQRAFLLRAVPSQVICTSGDVTVRMMSATQERLAIVYKENNMVDMYEVCTRQEDSSEEETIETVELSTSQLFNDQYWQTTSRFVHTPDYDHTGLITELTNNCLLKLFATSSKDNTVRLWNYDNQMVRELIFQEPVDSFCFATDYGYILAAVGSIIMYSSPDHFLPWFMLEKLADKEIQCREHRETSKKYEAHIKAWIKLDRLHKRQLPDFNPEARSVWRGSSMGLTDLDREEWEVSWQSSEGQAVISVPVYRHRRQVRFTREAVEVGAPTMGPMVSIPFQLPVTLAASTPARISSKANIIRQATVTYSLTSEVLLRRLGSMPDDSEDEMSVTLSPPCSMEELKQSFGEMSQELLEGLDLRDTYNQVDPSIKFKALREAEKETASLSKTRLQVLSDTKMFIKKLSSLQCGIRPPSRAQVQFKESGNIEQDMEMGADGERISATSVIDLMNKTEQQLDGKDARSSPDLKAAATAPTTPVPPQPTPSPTKSPVASPGDTKRDDLWDHMSRRGFDLEELRQGGAIYQMIESTLLSEKLPDLYNIKQLQILFFLYETIKKKGKRRTDEALDARLHKLLKEAFKHNISLNPALLRTTSAILRKKRDPSMPRSRSPDHRRASPTQDARPEFSQVEDAETKRVTTRPWWLPQVASSASLQLEELEDLFLQGLEERRATSPKMLLPKTIGEGKNEKLEETEEKGEKKGGEKGLKVYQYARPSAAVLPEPDKKARRARGSVAQVEGKASKRSEVAGKGTGKKKSQKMLNQVPEKADAAAPAALDGGELGGQQAAAGPVSPSERPVGLLVSPSERPVGLLVSPSEGPVGLPVSPSEGPVSPPASPPEMPVGLEMPDLSSDMLQLMDKGVSPSLILKVKRAHLPPSDVLQLLDLGLPADTIVQLGQANWRAEDMQSLMEQGLGLADIQKIASARMNADSFFHWLQRSIPLSDIFHLHSAGLRHDNEYLLTLRDLGMPMEGIGLLFSSGVPIVEVKRQLTLGRSASFIISAIEEEKQSAKSVWRDLGFDEEEADTLMSAGWTPRQVQVILNFVGTSDRVMKLLQSGYSANNIISFIKNNYSVQDVTRLVYAGISFDYSEEMRLLGFLPNDIVQLHRAGMSVDDVARFEELGFSTEQMLILHRQHLKTETVKEWLMLGYNHDEVVKVSAFGVSVFESKELRDMGLKFDDLAMLMASSLTLEDILQLSSLGISAEDVARMRGLGLSTEAMILLGSRTLTSVDIEKMHALGCTGKEMIQICERGLLVSDLESFIGPGFDLKDLMALLNFNMNIPASQIKQLAKMAITVNDIKKHKLTRYNLEETIFLMSEMGLKSDNIISMQRFSKDEIEQLMRANFTAADLSYWAKTNFTVNEIMRLSDAGLSVQDAALIPKDMPREFIPDILSRGIDPAALNELNVLTGLTGPEIADIFRARVCINDLIRLASQGQIEDIKRKCEAAGVRLRRIKQFSGKEIKERLQRLKPLSDTLVVRHIAGEESSDSFAAHSQPRKRSERVEMKGVDTSWSLSWSAKDESLGSETLQLAGLQAQLSRKETLEQWHEGLHGLLTIGKGVLNDLPRGSKQAKKEADFFRKLSPQLLVRGKAGKLTPVTSKTEVLRKTFPSLTEQAIVKQVDPVLHTTPGSSQAALKEVEPPVRRLKTYPWVQVPPRQALTDTTVPSTVITQLHSANFKATAKCRDEMEKTVQPSRHLPQAVEQKGTQPWTDLPEEGMEWSDSTAKPPDIEETAPADAIQSQISLEDAGTKASFPLISAGSRPKITDEIWTSNKMKQYARTSGGVVQADTGKYRSADLEEKQMMKYITSKLADIKEHLLGQSVSEAVQLPAKLTKSKEAGIVGFGKQEISDRRQGYATRALHRIPNYGFTRSLQVGTLSSLLQSGEKRLLVPVAKPPFRMPMSDLDFSSGAGPEKPETHQKAALEPKAHPAVPPRDEKLERLRSLSERYRRRAEAWMRKVITRCQSRAGTSTVPLLWTSKNLTLSPQLMRELSPRAAGEEEGEAKSPREKASGAGAVRTRPPTVLAPLLRSPYRRRYLGALARRRKLPAFYRMWRLKRRCGRSSRPRLAMESLALGNFQDFTLDPRMLVLKGVTLHTCGKSVEKAPVLVGKATNPPARVVNPANPPARGAFSTCVLWQRGEIGLRVATGSALCARELHPRALPRLVTPLDGRYSMLTVRKEGRSNYGKLSLFWSTITPSLEESLDPASGQGTLHRPAVDALRDHLPPVTEVGHMSSSVGPAEDDLHKSKDGHTVGMPQLAPPQQPNPREKTLASPLTILPPMPLQSSLSCLSTTLHSRPLTKLNPTVR